LDCDAARRWGAGRPTALEGIAGNGLAELPFANLPDLGDI
jgi:hypothetical protein